MILYCIIKYTYIKGRLFCYKCTHITKELLYAENKLKEKKSIYIYVLHLFYDISILIEIWV